MAKNLYMPFSDSYRRLRLPSGIHDMRHTTLPHHYVVSHGVIAVGCWTAFGANKIWNRLDAGKPLVASLLTRRGMSCPRKLRPDWFASFPLHLHDKWFDIVGLLVSMDHHNPLCPLAVSLCQWVHGRSEQFLAYHKSQHVILEGSQPELFDQTLGGLQARMEGWDGPLVPQVG